MKENLTDFENLSGLVDEIIYMKNYIDFQVITPTRATTRVAPTSPLRLGNPCSCPFLFL
jgi:hypothetical protein